MGLGEKEAWARSLNTKRGTRRGPECQVPKHTCRRLKPRGGGKGRSAIQRGKTSWTSKDGKSRRANSGPISEQNERGAGGLAAAQGKGTVRAKDLQNQEEKRKGTKPAEEITRINHLPWHQKTIELRFGGDFFFSHQIRIGAVASRKLR